MKSKNPFPEENLKDTLLARLQFHSDRGATHSQERGFLICAGGLSLATNAYVLICGLRRLSALPIELVYAGESEMPRSLRNEWEAEFSDLTFRDIWDEKLEQLPGAPERTSLRGYPIKPFAILTSPFREVFLLDADNTVLRNPEALFNHPLYRQRGALFWPDLPYARWTQVSLLEALGLPAHLIESEPEFESGQIVVDRSRCWRALLATCLLNGEEFRPFVYARNDGGDKDTFRLGFHFTETEFGLVEHFPVGFGAGFLYYQIPWNRREITIPLESGSFYETGILQHGLDGEPLFLHKTVQPWSVYRSFRISSRLSLPEGIVQPPWLSAAEERGFQDLERFRKLYQSHFPVDWQDLKGNLLMRLGNEVFGFLERLLKVFRQRG